MEIIALLPNETLGRLRASMGLADRVSVATSVSEVLVAVRGSSNRALVLDPMVALADSYERLVSGLAERETRVMVYARIDRWTCARVTALCRARTAELVSLETPDDCALLTQRLRKVGEVSVPAQMLHALADAFGQLPLPLQPAVVNLFGWRPIASSVEAFFGGVEMRRKTAEQALHAAGLVSAGSLINCAVLARSWESLQARHLSIAEAGAASGYQSVTTFRSHFRRFVGMSPRRVRHRLTREHLAAQLIVAIKRGRADGGSSADG